MVHRHFDSTYLEIYCECLSAFQPVALLSSSSGLCDNIIQDIICTYLVLPNRISIPLVGESQLAQLRFPVPKVTLDMFTLSPVMAAITPLSLSGLENHADP